MHAVIFLLLYQSKLPSSFSYIDTIVNKDFTTTSSSLHERIDNRLNDETVFLEEVHGYLRVIIGRIDMLTKERIEEIEQKARQVLSDMYGNVAALSPLINLAEILKDNGIQLINANFDNPEIIGAFDAQKKIIYVSQDEQRKTRQFFTVAHELGHFFLHSETKQEVFHRSQMDQFGDLLDDEQEANWFAASLLMPRELVTKEWHQHPDEQYIAARFGVSRAAAHWRLKNLNLVN